MVVAADAIKNATTITASYLINISSNFFLHNSVHAGNVNNISHRSGYNFNFFFVSYMSVKITEIYKLEKTT